MEVVTKRQPPNLLQILIFLNKEKDMGTYPGGNIIKVSPTISTDAYGATDLLFDKQEIKNIVPSRGGCSKLISMSAYADVTTDVDFTVMFFDNSTTLGIDANAALSGIADSVYKASGFIGAVKFDGADGGANMQTCRVYTVPSNTDGGGALPILLKAAEGKTSLWFAAGITSGTPDYEYIKGA